MELLRPRVSRRFDLRNRSKHSPRLFLRDISDNRCKEVEWCKFEGNRNNTHDWDRDRYIAVVVLGPDLDLDLDRIQLIRRAIRAELRRTSPRRPSRKPSPSPRRVPVPFPRHDRRPDNTKIDRFLHASNNDGCTLSSLNIPVVIRLSYGMTPLTLCTRRFVSFILPETRSNFNGRHVFRNQWYTRAEESYMSFVTVYSD